MDHHEAIAIQATEKYLLGELAPEIRDQFEEHLFDCRQCALDLCAGAEFVDQSKIILDQPEALRTPAPYWGWMQWLRPAFSIPVMATLLAIIGYQALNRSPGATASPRLLSSVSMIAANARGADTTKPTVPAGKAFIAYVDVPPVPEAVSYIAELLAPNGSVVWTLPVSTEAAKDTLALEIPPISGSPATYSLLIRAIDSKGQSSEVVRFPMSVGPR